MTLWNDLMRTALMLPLFLLSSLVAGEYTVKLERQLKAGDKANWIAKAKRKSSLNYSKDGKVFDSTNDDFEVTLEGEVTVRKVNERGQELISDIVVNKCERNE